VNEWLDPETDPEAIKALMAPFDPRDFQAKPVDPQLRRKNDRGQNNSPMLVEAIGEHLRAGS
jgi:putative SOS response-associated peptidase YedK